MKNKTGIIILAAGNSTRLGRPKQLLLYKGKSLIVTIAEEALKIPDNLTIVVLGYNNQAIAHELEKTSVMWSINNDWESGMASSIQVGMKALLGVFPELQRCIVSVCDQPNISSTEFYGLIQTQKTTGKGIVATEYANTLGVPVLFTQPYFNELLQLAGNEGAKKIVNSYRSDTALYPFEKAAIDIDTETDYEQLLTD